MSALPGSVFRDSAGNEYVNWNNVDYFSVKFLSSVILYLAPIPIPVSNDNALTTPADHRGQLAGILMSSLSPELRRGALDNILSEVSHLITRLELSNSSTGVLKSELAKMRQTLIDMNAIRVVLARIYEDIRVEPRAGVLSNEGSSVMSPRSMADQMRVLGDRIDSTPLRAAELAFVFMFMKIYVDYKLYKGTPEEQDTARKMQQAIQKDRQAASEEALRQQIWRHSNSGAREARRQEEARRQVAAAGAPRSGGRRKSRKHRKSKHSKKTLRRKRRQ